MQIIKKIEIQYFRSFGDKKNKNPINGLSDLNIFSGENDCGKSNVLRALNLFFNNEVANGVPFDFDRDISIFKIIENEKDFQDRKDGEVKSRRKDLILTVKIHFDLKNNKEFDSKTLPAEFWISKTWGKNGLINEKNTIDGNSNVKLQFEKEKNFSSKEIERKRRLLDKDGLDSEDKKEIEKELIVYNKNIASLKAGLTVFWQKIKYFYIPAIRDEKFFRYLYSQLQFVLNNIQKSKMTEATTSFETAIRKQTKSLLKKFEENTAMDTNFLVDNKFFRFEQGIELNTVSEAKVEKDKTETQKILLTQRGDGIQSRFIPYLLEEICELYKKVPGNSGGKKLFIWGFEEPENSYEYKKADELAKFFLEKLSIKKQIFITTHSFNFLALEGSNVSKFHIWKDKNDISRVVSITEDERKRQGQLEGLEQSEKEKLEERIGLYDLSLELKKIQDNKLKEIESIKLTKENLERNNMILYVEGESDKIILENAWKKIYPYTKVNFSLLPADGADNFRHIANLAKLDEFNNKIIFLNDYDDKGISVFKQIKPGVSNKKSMVDCSVGNFILKKNDNGKVWAMLLPVPSFRDDYVSNLDSGYLCIELLFSNNVLAEYKKEVPSFYSEKIIWKNNIYTIKDNSDAKIKFANKTKEFSKEDFKNFVPLFEKIKEIFETTN